MENVLSEADDTQGPAEELEINRPNFIHAENAALYDDSTL